MRDFRVDLDNPISEYAVNYMIARRYGLFSSKL